MHRPTLFYRRSPWILDRAIVDRLLFFLAVAIILAITAGPSPWASGLPIIVH
jgi:hypothetical protein